MAKISVGRLILGGIVAGIVGDILDVPFDGFWLSKMWSNQLSALGHSAYTGSQLILFDLAGIVVGLVAIWIYAGILPRFGPGVKTAICVGIAVWILAFLVPNFTFMWVSHLFSGQLALDTTIGNLVECVVGAIAGAAVYKEA